MANNNTKTKGEQYLVRLPKDLKEDLQATATAEHRSLSGQTIVALEEFIKQKKEQNPEIFEKQ